MRTEEEIRAYLEVYRRRIEHLRQWVLKDMSFERDIHDTLIQIRELEWVLETNK